MSEFAPVITAVAAFIALQGPAVANLLFTIANRKKLQQVHDNTNGNLKELRDEIKRLGDANAALQRKVDRLLLPPGPI